MEHTSDPHFDESKIKSFPIGKVVGKQRGEYHVLHGNQEIICSIRSRLRKNLVFPLSRQRRQSIDAVKSIQQADPVAVGDNVRFSFAEDDIKKGVIEFVETRQNQLSRKNPGPKPLEDVICANIDTLILVFALLQPKPKVGLIDRFMVAAEWEDIPVVLVLNKTDLDNGKHLEQMKEIYSSSHYRIFPTSVKTGSGIDELKQLMIGKTSVLVGPSGAGKTSLLNSIQPGLGLAVRAVNLMTGKGTHTTTNLKAFPLDEGGMVMDTPGLKILALWNLEPEELVTLYPEMEPLSGKCKFGLSCQHQTEPGCAIKEALEKGNIHQERFDSFLKLRDDLEKLYGNPYQ